MTRRQVRLELDFEEEVMSKFTASINVHLFFTLEDYFLPLVDNDLEYLCRTEL